MATPPKNQTGELQRLTLLFKIGLSTLHVRKPKLSAAEVDDYISSIPSKYHSRIIVHGNYPLVKKYGLKGYCIKRRHRSDKRKNLFQRLILRIRYPKKLYVPRSNPFIALGIRENLHLIMLYLAISCLSFLVKIYQSIM